jgi:hypothetical protein
MRARSGRRGGPVAITARICALCSAASAGAVSGLSLFSSTSSARSVRPASTASLPTARPSPRDRGYVHTRALTDGRSRQGTPTVAAERRQQQRQGRASDGPPPPARGSPGACTWPTLPAIPVVLCTDRERKSEMGAHTNKHTHTHMQTFMRVLSGMRA